MNHFNDRMYPSTMVDETLDLLLARGWYRMGQGVFTTNFILMGLDFFSTIWLRQELSSFKLSKRNAKRLRRLKERFSIAAQPLVIDNAREVLYKKYKADFKGDSSSSIQRLLFDNDIDWGVFNTWEISIHDGDDLIAYSVFDKGKSTLASIVGIYDPAYKDCSLGIMTMLLEMEYGKAEGFDYYYPGYFVPGFSRFDYKKTLTKNMEYYRPFEDKWYPLSMFDPKVDEVKNMLLSKLHDLQHYFATDEVFSQIYFYPIFDYHQYLREYDSVQFLEYPYFLDVTWHFQTEHRIIVVFNPWNDVYEIKVVDELMYEKYVLSLLSLKHSNTNICKQLLNILKTKRLAKDAKGTFESIQQFISDRQV